MHIGSRLRTLREEAGLSVSELARIIGVKHPSISAVEHGRTNPSFDTLLRWVEACGGVLIFERGHRKAVASLVNDLPEQDAVLAELLIMTLAHMSPERKKDLATLLRSWASEITVHAIHPQENEVSRPR